MNSFEFRQPDTVEEALTLMHDLGEDARVMAGGTALVIMMKQRLVMPDCLISLQKLRGSGSDQCAEWRDPARSPDHASRRRAV